MFRFLITNVTSLKQTQWLTDRMCSMATTNIYHALYLIKTSVFCKGDSKDVRCEGFQQYITQQTLWIVEHRLVLFLEIELYDWSRAVQCKRFTVCYLRQILARTSE